MNPIARNALALAAALAAAAPAALPPASAQEAADGANLGPLPEAVAEFDRKIAMDRIAAFLAEKRAAAAPAAAQDAGARFAVVLPVQGGPSPDRVYDKRPVLMWTEAPGAKAYRVTVRREGIFVLSETVPAEVTSYRPRVLLDP